MDIKKAIIPVAGKGTRFLPATKVIAKEIIPILNYPMIYYIFDEAMKSGIEKIILVTSEDKGEIEEFFTSNKSLELFLEEKNKTKELELIKSFENKVEIIYQEGCLSLPGINEDVKRALNIVVDYQDIDGNQKTIEATELLSICIQHENDHLEGIVFIERLSNLKKNFFKKKLIKDKNRN